MLTCTKDGNSIHELVGMIDSKDYWSMTGNVITSDNLDITKEYTQNRLKENLDSKVEQCLEFRDPYINAEGYANGCYVPWCDRRENM